ncbi:M23 family metallopeptidase [Salipaludibacillus sp. LMS25]|jgi:stage IV sporulation protein FA|uniref:M23 family metallopeptidase n=1 Tax=Salipaludibacillus sp. LMS25 TaxID=2924031 RepID=UPI0020D1995E|nr:M23 family metallopeptidase [Salipaludibacillus sp. LMS25]UTR15462.1 M23 family metallopeptidase [Salipaludibacillus sp. LMS25]
MNDRVAKLKRKMEARRRKRQEKKLPYKSVQRQRLRSDNQSMWEMKHDEEREATIYSFDMVKDRSLQKPTTESYFNKDTFIMQLLAGVCFFLIIGILMQTSTPALEQMRHFVERQFKEEFQFERVALWYEDLFGRPVALFPTQMETVAPGDLEEQVPNHYALPATGTIKETFEQNGRGIYVETDLEEAVEAVRSGVIRYIGEDEEHEWGQVVIVRHYDGGESWYGMLEDIYVNLYDHVDSGDVLASVSSHAEHEETGIYYFALKEGDVFIDPVDVISVD